MIKRVLFFLMICSGFLFAQEPKSALTLDVHNFYGTILKHNPDITHLITGHPSGLIVAAQRKTYGEKEWQRLYNYPDYGASFIYNDLDNEFLGSAAGLYLHYNFYFFNRNLLFRVGQGIAYTATPYHIDDNFRNIAHGSHLLSSTYFLLNYKRSNLIDRFGLQAGLGVVHYSNANFKAPNKSTNTFIFNAGITYSLEAQSDQNYIAKETGLVKGAEPMGFGFLVRSGINESDVVGSGQLPFLTLTAFADKRLNKKSAIQIGAELFFSKALERYIDFRATGRFNDGTTGDEDAKRAGAFIGHELRINKLSILTQLGYYFYYPYDFEGNVYNRMGLQYYISKNLIGGVSVRSHAAKAEAVEFSIGYRL
ncbi:acyloxyacyl hydrolase [Aquimarina brevivitae]|uniref:Lipid A 3-O-deacylase PagL n=1 Tax=Aquimarina brevivitae TaxID=323412 RepID=A0A4Q7NY43_9FLAO|nr:acyloxyacyl hydrolase [Aquimarina brevivitae]RZS92225.1 lipid A 3-O-deacylase PagL [Aquimarina brevivitae]